MKNFKIPENGLIPFANRGERNINEDNEFEIELLDMDVKWIEDCSDDEIDEFKNNGFVEKTDTNYNKKLESLKLKTRTALYDSNCSSESKPFIIKGLTLPYKTKKSDYEPNLYFHHFNDLFFCEDLVDEVVSRIPDEWVYYNVGMFLDLNLLMDISDEYTYQDVVNFLFWFEDYLKKQYTFVGDKILFGNKIMGINKIFKK